ncbi:MAG: substrate-binding domain-containing protein [Christensenella sp.]
MKKCVSVILAILVAAALFVVGCAPAAAPAESAAAPAESAAESAAAGASYEYKQVGEVANVKMVEKDPEKPLKFAFLGFQNNPFWNLVQQGVTEATTFLGQHNVTVENINLGENIDATVINNGLEAAVAQKYDGIITTPFVTGVENYIDAAVDAGIPVVTLYGESDKPSKRFVFIGQDNKQAGQTVAEAMDKALGGEKGAKFAVITASFTMENLEIKRNTVKDYLEGKGYVSVGDFEAKDSADQTYSITKDLLTANPDLKAIYCVAGGPYGAPKAVADAGKTGEVFVIGHDETAENIDYVRTGEMTVIGQNPTGVSFDGFVYLYNKVVAGQDPKEQVLAANSMIIDKNNVNELFPK